MIWVRRKGSFALKAVLALLLVAWADQLFLGSAHGLANSGLFALPLLVAAILAQPAMLARRPVAGLLILSLLFAALQLEAPSLLGWCLYWLALTGAVLALRAGAGDDAWAWAQRVLVQGFGAAVKPARDLRRLLHRPRNVVPRWRPLLLLLAVPVAGGALFLALFAKANPVLAHLLENIAWPSLDLPRLLFWVLAFMIVWAVLRPSRLRRAHVFAAMSSEALPLPGGSVALSLVVFNAIFALQNGLDIAFLWSGAKLPPGMSWKDYAHEGAYTLIATAILAGVFVLLTLRPGSPTARSSLVRAMLTLWIAQNLFLVASSALRTWNYVQVYLLTPLRIAALIWMGLVAVGLVLICWRLLRGKSAAWLLNVNALAAASVLAACSIIDLGAVSAAWNTTHSRELNGQGEAMDVCFIEGRGDGGVVSLARLGRRPLPPQLRDRVARAFTDNFLQLEARQGDWRTWSLRGMRRLEEARRLTAGQHWQDHPAQDCLAPEGPLTSPAKP